jgi:hypothetical protein
MNEIKILKLLTSEEVICQFVDMDENVVRIKKPYGIAPSPMGDGLSVFPWSVCSLRPDDDEVYEIARKSVIMIHNAPTEIASSYRNQTSKLYVAPSVDEKSLILG